MLSERDAQIRQKDDEIRRLRGDSQILFLQSRYLYFCVLFETNSTNDYDKDNEIYRKLSIIILFMTLGHYLEINHTNHMHQWHIKM